VRFFFDPGMKRRARNLYWSSSGDYSGNPLYVSYNGDGTPNVYINTIMGVEERIFGKERIRKLHKEFEGATVNAALSIALECYSFKKASPDWPVLAELRQEHAETTLKNEYRAKEITWTEWGTLSHNLEIGHLHMMACDGYHLPSKRQDALLRSLDVSSGLTPDEAESEIRKALSKIANFSHPGILDKVLSFRLFGSEKAFALSDAGGQGTFDEGKKRRKRSEERRMERDKEEARRLFGRDMLPQSQMREIENDVLSGPHEGLGILITDGKGAVGNEEIQHMQAENWRYFRENKALVEKGVRHLESRLSNLFAPRKALSPTCGLKGRFDSGVAWKYDALSSAKVFRANESENEPDFSVTVLLDGSASRSLDASMISSQAYMISESLRKCAVHHEVLSFCTFKSQTVIRVLEGINDSSSAGVFDYASLFMNRDGLALRAVRRLMAGRSGKKVLIVLSDAMPMDYYLYAVAGSLKEDYQGGVAENDTALEVRRLEKDGVRVLSVFMGSDAFYPKAKFIYRGNVIRIRNLSSFSSSVASLLESCVQN